MRLGVLVFSILAGASACSEIVETESDNASQDPTSTSQPDKGPAPIDEGVYSVYTRDGFPKLFAKWGASGIDRIQKLREGAAETAANDQTCDAVEISDFSENRSAHPDNPVVFVDCRNGKRFYMSERDVRAGGVASEQEIGAAFSGAELITRCTAEVKRQLNVPASFDQSMFSVSERQGTSGNRVVEFDFSAKNRLGAELPASARCIMTTQGVFEVTISE